MGDTWVALRRPLGVAALLGCAMSLMTSGRITLRLAVPAMVYWSFVPLAEIAGLAAASGGRPRAETVDRFFQGHGAWLVWVTAFAAVWGFVPAPVVFGVWYPRIWYATGMAAAAWSASVDFGFYREALGRSRGRAARDMVVQRAVCWPLVAAIWVGPAAWQVTAWRLGL